MPIAGSVRSTKRQDKHQEITRGRSVKRFSCVARCRAPYLEVIPIRGNDRIGLERQREGKYGTEKIFLCCCEVSNAQP